MYNNLIFSSNYPGREYHLFGRTNLESLFNLSKKYQPCKCTK